MDDLIRKHWKLFSQVSYFFIIYFHGPEIDAGQPEQVPGKGAATGAHFHQSDEGVLMQDIYDAMANGLIPEEVLTQ
jgi:hypothetical protein